ncbi:MAG TPA: LuxR C-terminal-related transcriptional regulator [Ramlibacter sp.]|nr:LuxR C-terminal-related transcriptional regulator [Ramlibacter sp.]
MEATILSAFSNLLLTIHRKAQELPLQEFQDSILNDIKSLLPFDSSVWGTATMTDAGIDIHSLHLHNTTQAMIDAYEKVKHLDVVAMRVAGQPVATLAFNSATDFEDAHVAYRDFLHKFRHENIFITSELNPITRFVHWVSLYRFDPAHTCKREETEVLACIAPHLMRALATNRLAHLDRLVGDTAREKWSVAIADGRGVLYHADRRFRDLIHSEWRSQDMEHLPQALLDRLMAEDGQVSGAHVLVRRSIERGLLFLMARPREEVDDLSPREFLVANLLARGLTQKQVAARLGRSPETIRSQVKTLFNKLDINNVATLAGKLVPRNQQGLATTNRLSSG